MDVGLEVERFLRHLLRMRCMRQSSREFVRCEILTLFLLDVLDDLFFIRWPSRFENNGVGSTARNFYFLSWFCKVACS